MKTTRKRSSAKPPTPLPIRTHTGWIRDTERAMRCADFHPIAKIVFFEMIDHTNDKERTCWASYGNMAIRLHLTPPTVLKYSRQLIQGKAIKRIGKGPKGTIKFEILEGWVNSALDVMTIRLDKHREAAAARQAKSRANRKANVTQPLLRPEPEMSRNDGLYASRNDGFDEHLQLTPSDNSYDIGNNPYAIAKGRA